MLLFPFLVTFCELGLDGELLKRRASAAPLLEGATPAWQTGVQSVYCIWWQFNLF